MRLFLLSVAFLLFSGATFSQTQPNLGFEYNNLYNWKCYRNKSSSLPISVTYNTNPLTGVNRTFDNLFVNANVVAGTGPKVGYVRPTTGAGFDVFAPARYSPKLQDTFPVPVVCPLPGAGKHSVKLGNDSLGSVCEGVSYNIHILQILVRLYLVLTLK